MNGKSKVIYTYQVGKGRFPLESGDRELRAQFPGRLEQQGRKCFFSPGTISFSPYGKGQIIDILEERVDKAFRFNSVPSEALERITDFASAPGDCHLALQCLMKAGRRADYEGANSLELGQIESVLESKQG